VPSTEMANQVALNNILYLTDFSPASEAALPLVSALAGESRLQGVRLTRPSP
jgi:hypothetical protein